MSTGIETCIRELISLTKSIAEFTGEVDDDFLVLLEQRNQQFQEFQNKVEKMNNDPSRSAILTEESYLVLLRELQRFHNQAEEVVTQHKQTIADQIKKIGTAKQTSNLYDQGRNRALGKRYPHQATPDAAFFDQKK